MGYLISNLTADGLLDFVREEYDYINWDEKSLDTREDYIAVWGWSNDGTYEVALAIRNEQTDDEVEDFSSDFGKHSKNNSDVRVNIHLSDWYVKIMNEVEGPVIQPSGTFIKGRPSLTLEAKRRLKEAEERHSLFERIKELHTDTNNEGMIQSAVSCGNGQIFIWTTQGNYYIPKSAYDAELAMLGVLTVNFLKENNVPMQPTLEEYPHSVYNNDSDKS